MSEYSFIRPDSAYRLPSSFDYPGYIEIERELWALFPETDGKRVNFVQVGLTALLYTEVPDDCSEIAPDEAYILMPCPDRTLRPLRMRACRRLTLSEYRMSHLTAIRLAGKLCQIGDVMQSIGRHILGAEVLEAAESGCAGED